MWHLTRDMWHMTCDRLLFVAKKNVRSQKSCWTVSKILPEHPKNDVWPWSGIVTGKVSMIQEYCDWQDISRESGYAGKLKATVSWFQRLNTCWNYTELLRSDSQVATSWYVLFCTANRQATFLGSQKPSQKLCVTIIRHTFWYC